VIVQIVGDYASGISTTRLAVRYRLGKGTLLRLLREHDVEIRRRGSHSKHR
jgi:hypothetical protein